MKPGDYIEVSLENSRLGTGRRRVLVLAVGRKWVDLFHPETLTKMREDLGALYAGAPAAIELQPGQLASHIEDVRAQFDAARRRYSADQVRAALEVLGARSVKNGPRANADTVGVSLIAIKQSPAFGLGFNDARLRRPPRERLDGVEGAGGDAEWSYERGRLFAHIFRGAFKRPNGTITTEALIAYADAKRAGEIL